ncbi:hypothetical protein CUMW_209260, partial [Citrus unshiu]
KLNKKMSNPHVLVIPAPAQGHVIPLLEFSQCLANHGVRVTFVNSEYNHQRVLKSLEGKNNLEEKIRLVSIPDGMEPWEDRNELGNKLKKILQVMPGKLEELIEEINEKEDEKIDCFIADAYMGWTMRIAEKMKLRRGVVWPSSAASVALCFRIPKLIDDGIISSDGTPIRKQMIELAPNMPVINSADVFWARLGDLTRQKIFFDYLSENMQGMRVADFQFCNSTYDLEPAAFTVAPKVLPIGPLLASNRLGNSTGYFWPEDSTCLEWLEQQQPNSVIYVAFGSSTVFEKIKFQELALGLELSNRPFLWVVRSDITNEANGAYPDGFQERVATRGKIIGWAPQQKVLSHPSISCFLSHCGWNSTMEGVSNGVPFLCWPYFAEQFLNESYICDVWKVGLKLDRNESGIFTREEIKNKVDQMFRDQNYKARALELKEKALSSVREEIKKSVQRNKQSICSGITLSCTRPYNTHAGVSQWLVKHGFTITLSNTEYNHRQVMNILEEKNYVLDQIHLISIPDGLETWEDRSELGKLTESLMRVMPRKRKELIKDSNARETHENITYVIADGNIEQGIKVAEKLNIQSAAFWPAAAAVLALNCIQCTRLIDDESIIVMVIPYTSSRTLSPAG